MRNPPKCPQLQRSYYRLSNGLKPSHTVSRKLTLQSMVRKIGRSDRLLNFRVNELRRRDSRNQQDNRRIESRQNQRHE